MVWGAPFVAWGNCVREHAWSIERTVKPVEQRGLGILWSIRIGRGCQDVVCTYVVDRLPEIGSWVHLSRKLGWHIVQMCCGQRLWKSVFCVVSKKGSFRHQETCRKHNLGGPLWKQPNSHIHKTIVRALQEKLFKQDELMSAATA